MHDSDENPLVFLTGPIGQAAVRLRAIDAGVEFPEELAGRGVQREDVLRGRDAVENSTDNDRAGLKAALLAGVERPRDFKLLYIAAIDLSLRRVVHVCGAAA